MRLKSFLVLAFKPFLAFSFLLLFNSLAFGAQLKLAWDANTELDLAGYRVYYGTSSGNYGSPVSVGNVTTYTMTGLTQGQTYFVAVTAIDTLLDESGYSNEVSGAATDGTQTFTVASNPSGLQVVVDSVTYTTPQAFSWAAGSSHTLSLSSPQAGSAGTRYVFASWSDGGAQNHTITAPSASTTYTANFTTQYSLSTAANPSGGGTVSPSGTNWYNSGQSASISATASSGYAFSGWTGDLTGATNPTSLSMNGVKNVTANFNLIPPTLSYTIATSPTGLQITVDGTSYTASQTFSWTVASSHTISVSSPQNGVSGTRYVFASWGDSGAQSHTVTAPSSSTTYTATFTTQYSLTTALSPSVGGTVSPSGTNWYNSGQNVSISATANPGYAFSGWTGDLTGTTNPASLTMNGTKGVTATFVLISTETITTSPAGQQITVDGTNYTAPQTFTWTVGSSHTISVSSPQNGSSGTRYVFASWSDGGAQSHTISGPTSSTTYTATLTTQYSLTTAASPSGGGTASPSGTNWYDSGQSASISATASSGYAFSGWTGDASGTTNPVTVTMNSNKTVTATFTPIYTLTVNISPTAGGSVTANPNKTTYNSGDTVTLTATANSGYTFSSWSGGATGTTSPVTVTMNSNKTVTATFTPIYTLTVNISPTAGGSVTKNPNNTTYAPGTQVTLTATANSAYTFTSWSGGATGTANPVTVTMNGNMTVTATFTQNTPTQYNLTVTISPSGGGSVSANPNSTTYASGTQVTLTATANSGYVFTTWSGDATGTTSPVAVTMNSDKTVTATFTPIYTLTVNISPTAGGSVSANPNSTTYASGTQVTLTATANSGYTFSSWTGDASGTTNPVTVTMNGNKIVTATFVTPTQYNLTVTISPSGGGSVTKSPNNTTYASGTQVTLTATANSGYTFSSWSGGATGTTSPVAVTMNSDKTVTATFTPIYTLTVNISPAAGGSVTKSPNSTTYAPGTQVTLTATANSGYTFSSWSGGATGTTSPVTVTMDGNKTVTATFTPTYTLTVNISPSGGGTVTANPNRTTFNSGTQVTLTAMASSGFTFTSWGGDATGTTNPVTVTMNAVKNITAQFTASQATFQLSCPDAGIQCLERTDGANDGDNLVNGKPKVDVEFQFKVVVQDSGGTPKSVKLFMTQRSSPIDPNDFYDYEMACGGNYASGANCTYDTILGPAAVHKFYLQAQMSDGSTVKRYPSTGFITGPEIYLLEGNNHIGVPRDINNAQLNGQQAVGSSRVYRWDAAGESYTAVTTAAPAKVGEGYSIYKENDTLPELASYTEVAGLQSTYSLSPGANLVSNPFTGNVKLADVQIQKGTETPVSWSVAVANGWVVNALYYYNGKDWGNTYSHMTVEDGAVLVPWLGYWVDLNMTDATYYLVFSKP